MSEIHKIVIAITGASGSVYARQLCMQLAGVASLQQIAVITTRNAEAVSHFEDSLEWLDDPRFTRYDNGDLFGAPASGSADFDAMVIVPCSMGMIGRIAAGVSDDLVSRAADVMLKERRRLIVVPRETPLSLIHLRNMTTLAECGAIVCPASPSFYSHPDTIETLCRTVTERIVSLLGIPEPHYTWGAK